MYEITESQRAEMLKVMLPGVRGEDLSSLPPHAFLCNIEGTQAHSSCISEIFYTKKPKTI